MGIFWLATLIMLWRLKGSKEKSISNHAASSKRVAIPFAIVAVIASTLLGLFFFKWFTPNFEFSTIFGVLAVAIVALYAIAGIVPQTKGVSQKVHFTAAVSASLLLLPAMTAIILNEQINNGARTFTFAALLLMFVLGFTMLRKRQTVSRVLFYEALYFLCFDISVMVITYLG